MLAVLSPSGVPSIKICMDLLINLKVAFSNNRDTNNDKRGSAIILPVKIIITGVRWKKNLVKCHKKTENDIYGASSRALGKLPIPCR